MYINPFWCGVIATILVELGLLIGYAIYDNAKKKKNKLLKFYNYKVYSGGIDISSLILDMVKLNGG